MNLLKHSSKFHIGSNRPGPDSLGLEMSEAKLTGISRRLNTEKLGVRHDRIQLKETVSTKDVKRMLCSMGPDPIDEDEIEQFLADIGFADDKFVKITDFAKFLME